MNTKRDDKVSVPIQAGDLVQVVRGCCGRYVGIPRRVASFRQADSKCPKCGYEMYGFTKAVFENCEMPRGAPLHWLRRIPPLSELEGQRTEESLRVPGSPTEYYRRALGELREWQEGI